MTELLKGVANMQSQIKFREFFYKFMCFAFAAIYNICLTFQFVQSSLLMIMH